MSRQRVIGLALAAAVSAQTAAVAQRSISDPTPMRLPAREKQTVPLHRKELNLEDLFPKTEIPYAYPNPVDLQGQTVGGLSEKNSTSLSTNLFVVVDNTKFDTMAELYRANRLKGKSNFVTVDALMHSFLAVRNGMLASSIEEHAIPDLISLLVAMMKNTAADYREADDADVRADLEKNLAFLNVGVKLLDPTLPSAQLGNSAGLATRELQNIRTNQKKNSAIYNVEEDYSVYRPYGWYDTSAKLRNFYRAKTWLSRVSFLLSENTSNDGTGDSFRRSALLFRALEKAVVGSQTGMQVWQRLNGLMDQLGPKVPTEIKTLTPVDYKEVFKSANGDLRMSLQGLAEPFYRTKLLLSVRRQRPLQISSTSIFDIDTSHTERATQACFRLFPITEQPELPWLRQRGHEFSKEGSDVPAPPLALLDLHAHGVTQATNVLGENIWKLDPTLTGVVPSLVQTLKKQPNRDFVWNVLGNYFKMPTEAVQAVLKTNLWMTRKLESGFGAWLDSQLALTSAVPVKKDEDEPFPIIATSKLPQSIQPGTQNSAASGNKLAPAATTVATAIQPSTKHYVEPCPDVFRNMRTETQRLLSQLQSIGYEPKAFAPRVQELTILLNRLESIASREVSGLSPLQPDVTFLSNIDIPLEKFSPPTTSSLYLDTGVVNEDNPKGIVTTGATIALGRPAMLFIIFQNGRNLTVARGAMYSYHELSGGPIKPEHLERKMEFGFLSPPAWTEQFEVIQDQPPIGGK